MSKLVSPEMALKHLDTVLQNVPTGSFFDEARVASVELGKSAIEHCKIATAVKVDKCDEKAHYKCPSCDKILFTRWSTSPRASIGEKTAFCKQCGKLLSWEGTE